MKTNTKPICIIPARMNSSRFPGKPLKLINKIPMIQHVYNNVKKKTQTVETYMEEWVRISPKIEQDQLH